MSESTSVANHDELIKIVDSLLEKIKVNDVTMAEHQIIAATTGTLTNQVVEVLQRVVTDMRQGDGSSEERLSRSTDVISSLMGSLETSRRSAEDEAIRVEAIQEGMRRALMAVRLAVPQAGDAEAVEEEPRTNIEELPAR